VEQRVDADRLVAEGLRLPPAPDVLLALCRWLAVRPDEMVSFTASRLGVEAGVAAGVEVVGVGVGERAEELAEAGADRIARSLVALLDTRLAGAL
ncbi:MAG: hypothetical protein ACRC50_08925, partial [Gaiella sp.]